MMSESEEPKNVIVRDDGCVCPAPPPPKVCERKLTTCPYDPRFPNTNQTNRCYSSFLDYQRCARLLGDYPGCNYFLRCYRALCPIAWQEKWFEQMEKGTFPKRIYPPKPIIRPDDNDCLDSFEEEEPQEVC